MKVILIVIFLLFTSNSFAYYLKVGASEEDISPTPIEAEFSCLAGYTPFLRCGVEEISDPLLAKSLYISNDIKQVLFVVIDAIGVGDSLINEIRTNVENRTRGNVKAKNIFVIATHTHSGPDIQGLWGGVSKEYRDRIVTRATSSALRAIQSSTPAIAHISATTAPVSNRRGLDRVEDEIFVIDFVSSNLNNRIATLVNMSAHPTVLESENLVYSSDYVGYLRLALAKELGGTAIFINGVVGDMEPTVDERSVESAQKYGFDVAETIINNLKNYSAPLGNKLQFKTKAFKHSIVNPLILGALSANLLDLDVNDQSEIDVEYTIMTLGRAKIVLVPGEALSGTMLPIKDKLNSQYEMTFGLANGSFGYFIPSAEYGTVPDRDTEESVSLSPLIGDELLSGILSLIH